MKVEDIKTVAIVGAGFMGPGLAQVFATQGYQVYLMDINPDALPKALDSMHSNLNQMAKESVIRSSEIDLITKRVKTTTDMHQAVLSAQLVIEAVNENLGLKQNIFRELDGLCPVDAILCTNTSVMSISEIASRANHRDRIVGTHFWNPPYLIPLVEVVKGRDTSNETMNVTFDFLKKAGKHPVKCLKDVPGFIANRLQHALWREAISIVENGVADARTVDEAIKNSFAIRLPVLGPLENADMVGLDLTFSIHDYVFKYLENSPEPSSLLREKVQKGDLGFKSGKGFYDWSPEEAQLAQERLSSYLINRMKEQD